MAFFEDIGKKVTQTSQDAIKKTKILAETTKINSQISSERRVIGENYTKIGEKYFELFSESPDENLAAFVSAIVEAQSKIQEFEEQIVRLKGALSCPNCGTELKEGALFCMNCGSKMEQPPEPQEAAPQPSRFCNSCGAPMAPDANFCGNCGNRTEE